MLIKIFANLRFYARKLNKNAPKPPEGVERTKFTEEELSNLGHAARG